MQIIEADAESKLGEGVGSFEKGLMVIRALSTAPKGMTLAELAEATGTTRPSARRYLLSLMRLGYAEQITKRYELTPKILELGGNRYDSGLIWQIAKPVMEGLARDFGESCSAFVRDEGEVVCAAHADAEKFMAFRMAIGTRLPALNTAAGRVILSEISDECVVEVFGKSPPRALTEFSKTGQDEILGEIRHARDNGFALVDQELELGLKTLAVPVATATGRIAGALNISADSTRVQTDRMLSEFLPPLKRAAASISGMLMNG